MYKLNMGRTLFEHFAHNTILATAYQYFPRHKFNDHFIYDERLGCTGDANQSAW